MITLACTKKILSRAGFVPEATPPNPTTALGDWHVNIIFVYHSQWIMFVNDVSRLAVITPARKIKSLGTLLANELPIVLKYLNVPDANIEAEVNEMEEAHIAATRNRSVLGTMNDYLVQIEARISPTGEIDMRQTELELTKCISSAINYQEPGEVALSLLRKRYSDIYTEKHN
jgi:hypothetical protein